MSRKRNRIEFEGKNRIFEVAICKDQETVIFEFRDPKFKSPICEDFVFLFSLFNIYLFILFVCVCVYSQACHCAYVEVRGQFWELELFYQWVPETELGHQPWWQAHLSSELSPQVPCLTPPPCLLKNYCAGGRGRRISVNLRPSWSTKSVPGQPEKPCLE